MIMFINVFDHVCDGFFYIDPEKTGGRERLFKRSNWWTKLIKYEKISIQFSEFGGLIKFCNLRNPYLIH